MLNCGRDLWSLQNPTTTVSSKLVAQCSRKQVLSQLEIDDVQHKNCNKREPGRQVGGKYHHPHTPTLGTKVQKGLVSEIQEHPAREILNE